MSTLYSILKMGPTVAMDTIIKTDSSGLDNIFQGRELLRLLQLASANLPVGGYSFSQGLEVACEQGWLTNVEHTRQWLATQIEYSLSYLDVPILLRAHRAASSQSLDSLRYWDNYLIASRETSELHQAEIAMGQALRRLMISLEVPYPLDNPCSYVTGFAIAAVHWKISAEVSAYGYCWSWLENQVMAATKLVPLGQTQAQQLLCQLQELIPQCLAVAQGLNDNDLGASLPGLSIASSLHESQYSRLFRS